MSLGGVISCKAAVAWAAGEPLVIEEVDLSPPHLMEIRIKVVCTSLCRSDLTAWLSQVFNYSECVFEVIVFNTHGKCFYFAHLVGGDQFSVAGSPLSH